MITGAKNESMVLQAFSKLSIFEVGLLENKTYLWMEVSPDGVAVLGFDQDDENIVAFIEIKTRVAVKRIQHAEELAAKYQHKLIVSDIGDDTWKESVEEEHSAQVLLQLWVMQLQTEFYIVATLGSSTSSGKITYFVKGHLLLSHVNDFFDRYSSQQLKDMPLKKLKVAPHPATSLSHPFRCCTTA
jgi:hypothetical protein